MTTSPEQGRPADEDAAFLSLASAVEEAVEKGDGFWRGCSGCHELNEGHATGPYSKALRCHVGVGCGECGGLGAIWDDTDYGEMARSILADDVEGEPCPTCGALPCDQVNAPALASQAPGEGVESYNATFDPANEAGQEAFEAGFRTGWLHAHSPHGWDEEAEEEYSRSVDGVILGEAWDAHRDAFFARLPLAALPPPPSPEAEGGA